MIYFTSDLHFGHKNVIEYAQRPFSTVQEMDEALINNWNKNVTLHDQVYIVGDFCLSRPEYAISCIERLNGRKYLVTGNHDRILIRNQIFQDHFEWIKPLTQITVEDETAPSNKQEIILCHYAMRVWNKSHHGSIHLHGHSHGSLPPLGKSVDIGVDSTWITGKAEYRPFSVEEVLVYFSEREE